MTSAIIVLNILQRCKCAYPLTHSSPQESYESADRHSYISAAVTVFSCLLMLLGLVVLYKKLAPRNTPQSSPKKHESTNNVDPGKTRFD